VCVERARHNIYFGIIAMFVMLDLHPSAQNIKTCTKFHVFPSNVILVIVSYPITEQFFIRPVCYCSRVHKSMKPVEFARLCYHNIRVSKQMSLTLLPYKFARLLMSVKTSGNTIMTLSCRKRCFVDRASWYIDESIPT
jgi:hypothetical protein